MTTQKTALAKRFALAMQAASLSPDEPMSIAFSGGGDSLALLALACDLFPERKIHALIVDHALRRESAPEARCAAAMASALGAKAHILTSKSPRAGHKHARSARYTLLAKACHGLGTRTLFLAHTLDDQEETFAIRLARGSTARGLACMGTRSPLPAWPEGQGIWLARPLLAMCREELRHWLKAHDFRWIDDPSNQNRRYARVRVRQHLAALHGAGLQNGRIAKSTLLLGQLENERRNKTMTWLQSALSFYPAGYALLPRLALETPPVIIAHMALGAILASVAGLGFTPVPNPLVHRTLIKLRTTQGRGFCAAGCRLSIQGPDILISRDPGVVLGRAPNHKRLSLPVKASETLYFDDRFHISAAIDGWIETLGNRARLLPPLERKILMALPAPVRPVVPVLRDQTGALSSPVLGGVGEMQFLGKIILSRKLAPFSHGTE
ncbi:MAG: tRNA lysidine(34) synthetase TilS [Robiginitomaculum sp.]|nr:MAG: tRNA lysidine(34) synthetase TilS [Robiginitomaculum sp.]